ncbi:MAG: hypothetical protein ACI89U_002756 [Gammaproteobacteria bacterium]|jgi:hypothetical protein
MEVLSMVHLKEDFSAIVAALKTERDVLAVKMNLAKAEVKTEWGELEKKWEKVSFRSEKIKQELQETSSDVGEDFKDLAEDLKEGYSRIKRLLK